MTLSFWTCDWTSLLILHRLHDDIRRVGTNPARGLRRGYTRSLRWTRVSGLLRTVRQCDLHKAVGTKQERHQRLVLSLCFFAKSYQLLQRLQKAKMSSDQACSIIFIYCHGVFLIFGTTCFWCLCSVMITAWSCGQMPEIARIRADKFEESAGSGFRCHRLHQDTTYLTHHHYLQALLDTWHVAPSLQSWLLIALGTPNQCKAFDGASSSMRPAISQH